MFDEAQKSQKNILQMSKKIVSLCRKKTVEVNPVNSLASIFLGLVNKYKCNNKQQIKGNNFGTHFPNDSTRFPQLFHINKRSFSEYSAEPSCHFLSRTKANTQKKQSRQKCLSLEYLVFSPPIREDGKEKETSKRRKIHHQLSRRVLTLNCVSVRAFLLE